MKSCKGCKHYKRNENSRLIVCEFGLDSMSKCAKDMEDFAVEELEKIIDEINELSYSRAGAYESEFSMCLDLLDEHIAKLKEES